MLYVLKRCGLARKEGAAEKGKEELEVTVGRLQEKVVWTKFAWRSWRRRR